jgi:hypothetical protein
MVAAKAAGAAAPAGGAGAPPPANALVPANPVTVEPPRDPSGKFTDEEIWNAFQAFDLDKNNLSPHCQ